MTRHVLIGTLCLLTLLGVGCDTNTDGVACADVEGTVEGLSAPVFDAEGQLTGFQVVKASVVGDLPGTSSADFAIRAVDDDGTLHLAGSHTFWDGRDALRFRTEDEGRTTADGRVENHMTLVEGATGRLTTTGTVDVQTGALVLAYTGRVCR